MKKEVDVISKEVVGVIDNIVEGLIRVPTFQRNYVWPKKKVVKFLNSLINDEPFGTILLWTPKDKEINLGFKNTIIESLNKISQYKHKGGISFLIDGQQRLTSLLLIRYYKKISDTNAQNFDLPKGWNLSELIKFDYENEEFVVIKKNEKLPNTIDSEILLSNNDFNHKKVRNLIQSEDASLKADKINKIVNKINKIKVSIIELKGHSLDNVITIFSNVNNQGTKLTTFDLVHAKWSSITTINNKTGGNVTFELNDEIKEMTNDWKNGYSNLNASIFMDCIYLFIKNNGDQVYSSEDKINFNIIEEYRDEEVLVFFEKAKKAYTKSYKFLSETLNMYYKFLPSDVIMKWLTYFFYKFEKHPTGHQVDIIKEYIKLSCINGRYSRSTIEKLKKDIDFVNEILLSNEPKTSWDNYDEKINLFKISKISEEEIMDISYKGASMISKYIKYILFNNTVSFQKGTKHFYVDSTDMHHIFPQNSEYVKTNNISEKLVNSMPNLTPLNEDENRIIIKHKNPDIYYAIFKETASEDFEKNLLNHGIKSEFLQSNDFYALINFRKKYITKLVNGKNK